MKPTEFRRNGKFFPFREGNRLFDPPWAVVHLGGRIDRPRPVVSAATYRERFTRLLGQVREALEP